MKSIHVLAAVLLLASSPLTPSLASTEPGGVSGPLPELKREKILDSSAKLADLRREAEDSISTAYSHYQQAWSLFENADYDSKPTFEAEALFAWYAYHKTEVRWYTRLISTEENYLDVIENFKDVYGAMFQNPQLVARSEADRHRVNDVLTSELKPRAVLSGYDPDTLHPELRLECELYVEVLNDAAHLQNKAGNGANNFAVAMDREKERIVHLRHQTMRRLELAYEGAAAAAQEIYDSFGENLLDEVLSRDKPQTIPTGHSNRTSASTSQGGFSNSRLMSIFNAPTEME